MKLQNSPLLLVTALLLSGCAQYVWMKPAGDPSTFPNDNYNCKQSALTNAPPVFQTYGAYPMHMPPDVRTRCIGDGHHRTCKTIIVDHDHYVPPPHTVDLNAGTRNDLYNACMSAQGWVLQKVEE